MVFAVITTFSLCKNCLEHEHPPHVLENDYTNAFYLRSATMYNVSAGTATAVANIPISPRDLWFKSSIDKHFKDFN